MLVYQRVPSFQTSPYTDRKSLYNRAISGWVEKLKNVGFHQICKRQWVPYIASPVAETSNQWVPWVLGPVEDDSNVDIHVKVIDWGLGFYFKRAHMKTCVGTSAYAAPEVQQPVPRPAIFLGPKISSSKLTGLLKMVHL